ncbi:MAG: hypothetical protein ACNFW9_04840 [Candidatus Kerfeldbacteria bacterium]
MASKKDCNRTTSIETLHTITEYSSGKARIARNRVIHLNNLLNVLLEPTFNEGEAARIIDGLKKLRCPSQMIQTRVLSVLAFHEAMDPDKWSNCRGEWIKACGRLEISEFATGQAISVGQSIRAQLYLEKANKKNFQVEIRKEVQKVFFGAKRVIKQL